MDYGLHGVHARLNHLREAFRLVIRARRAETVVVLTAGLEVYAVAATLRLLRRSTRFVVIDFLMPATTRMIKVQKWALRRVDAWGCIRSGDIHTLRGRFAIDERRCVFLSFPPTFDATEPLADEPPLGVSGDYVYAAGNAYRDWATLFAALRHIDCDAVISGDDRLPDLFPDLPANIRLVGPLSPADGRAVASRATIVLVPLQETIMPAGPVVLVDAMALGRPVIATDTNGTRDYIRHGVTGWLVGAGDPMALARIVTEVLAHPDLRATVGEAARRAARDEFSADEFARRVTDLCRVSPPTPSPPE